MEQHEIRQAKWFAYKVLDSNSDEYLKRSQASTTKILIDITCGKIAELAVAKMLGSSCTQPDFKIYSAKRKSFDADLVYKKFNIHVKSQLTAQAKIFGASWSFQLNDPIICREAGMQNDYAVFCTVDNDFSRVVVEDFISVRKIKEILKPPKKASLTSKGVVYLEDLKAASGAPFVVSTANS